MSDRARINRPFERQTPEVEGVPAEEGVSESDAVERLDLDPEGQPNYTEVHGQRTQVNQPQPDPVPDGRSETGPDDREESIELDKPEYDDA